MSLLIVVSAFYLYAAMLSTTNARLAPFKHNNIFKKLDAKRSAAFPVVNSPAMKECSLETSPDHLTLAQPECQLRVIMEDERILVAGRKKQRPDRRLQDYSLWDTVNFLWGFEPLEDPEIVIDDRRRSQPCHVCHASNIKRHSLLQSFTDFLFGADPVTDDVTDSAVLEDINVTEQTVYVPIVTEELNTKPHARVAGKSPVLIVALNFVAACINLTFVSHILCTS